MKNKRKIACWVLICYFIVAISAIFPLKNVLADSNLLPSGLTVQELDYETTTYLSENNPNNAAVAFAVADSNSLIYESITGYINRDEGLLADSDTIFEWGSMTKMLTWISLMQLYEQGKLDFNEDISNYLTDGFFKKRTYSGKITALELMNHSAGWQDSITNVYTDDVSNILPLKEFLMKNEPPQLYAPGEVVAYSNWGTALGGYLVEVLSGEDYCDYIREHIFAPLSMQKTSIDPLRRDNEFVKNGLNKVVGYDTNGKAIHGHYYAPDYPAASAAGTLSDVMLFAQALIKDRCPLFEKKETRDTMFTTTREFAGTKVPENAHGFWYDFYTTPSLGHNGNTVQFSSHFSLSPEKGIGMVVMTNQAQEMALTQGLGNYVFGEPSTDAKELNFTPLNFKKNYCSARTIQKGYCSFYNFFQTFQIKEISDTKYQICSLMSKINCERISNDCLFVSDGILKGYRFYLDVDETNTVTSLATTTFDLIPFSDNHVIRDYLSYGGLALALIFILITIVSAIRGLRLKRNLKRSHIFALIASILSILYFACIPLEAAKLMTTAAATKDMIPIVGYYIFYLIFSVFSLIFFFRSQKKSLSLTLSVLACLLLSGFTLYWQMIFIWV